MCRVPVSQNLEIQTALNSQFYPKKKIALGYLSCQRVDVPYMITSGTQPHPPAVQTFFFVRSSQSRLKGTVGLKKHELKQLASKCA